MIPIIRQISQAILILIDTFRQIEHHLSNES